MGYLAKGKDITQSEIEVINSIEPIGSSLQYLRVNSAGTSLEYATLVTGGLTQLSSTETPDGITTVFTFSTASAQPSFVVSDNVLMKATTKSGTVNWTWNAGAKQATMTIAPVDDIFAIV